MSSVACTLALMAVLTMVLMLYIWRRCQKPRDQFTAGGGATNLSPTPYCQQTTHSCVACFTNAECGGETPYCEGGRCVSACKPGAGGALCIDGACIDGIADSYCGATTVPRVLRDREGAWNFEPTNPAQMPASTVIDAGSVGACVSAATAAGSAAAMFDRNQSKCVLFPSTEGLSAVYVRGTDQAYVSIALRPNPLLMCRDGVCHRCSTDAECGAGLRCLDQGMRCAECSGDADCGAGQKCIAGNCQQCSVDADCGAGAPFCENGLCAPCRPGQPGGVCNFPDPFCVAGGTGVTCGSTAPLPRVGRGLRLVGAGGSPAPAPLVEAALSFAECQQATREMGTLVAAQYDETTKSCAAYDSVAGLYVGSANRAAGEPTIYVFENQELPRV